jgi:hypothetical protein
MGVDAIYNIETTTDTTTPIRGEIHLDGHNFEYEVYLLPIIGGTNKHSLEQNFIKRIGNRFQNGKHCLDITEEIVRKNILNNEYSAIIFVKNKAHNDSASATLQYYDWCNSGINQIWINDLCRIADKKKQPVSPVKVLFKVVEMITLQYIKELRHINLFVDNLKPDRNILINLYKNYGFKPMSREKCAMQDSVNKYTIMRRRIFRRVRGKSSKRRSVSGGHRKTLRDRQKK